MSELIKALEEYASSTDKVQSIADEMFPKLSIHIDREIRFHCKTYPETTEVFRQLEIQRRDKHISYDGTCWLSAYTSKGVHVVCYCNELPPTCRLVTSKRKIPKTKVVELNDEFCEIEEIKVICDGEEKLQ